MFSNVSIEELWAMVGIILIVDDIQTNICSMILVAVMSIMKFGYKSCRSGAIGRGTSAELHHRVPLPMAPLLQDL